jgi:methylated-DNA-[protein]-cysteine S-methyltransferase
MPDASSTLFDTALGRCGIVWRRDSIVAFALPGRDDRLTLASLSRRWPDVAGGAPPEPVRAAIEAVRRLLDGERIDLGFVDVDLDGVSDFDRRVYGITRAIPAGETRTYGEIARELGEPGAARAIGRAMGDNPVPVIVPCHRVLAASGRIGGFSAPGGIDTKRRLLAIESAHAPLPLFAAAAAPGDR